MLELDGVLELGGLAELCPPLPVGVSPTVAMLELEDELELETCPAEET